PEGRPPGGVGRPRAGHPGARRRAQEAVAGPQAPGGAPDRGARSRRAPAGPDRPVPFRPPSPVARPGRAPAAAPRRGAGPREGALERRPAGAADRGRRQGGALALPRLVPAYENRGDLKTGSDLVAALGQAPGLRSLTPEALRKALKGYPPEVLKQADPLFGRLALDVAAKSKVLAELEPIVRTGEP